MIKALDDRLHFKAQVESVLILEPTTYDDASLRDTVALSAYVGNVVPLPSNLDDHGTWRVSKCSTLFRTMVDDIHNIAMGVQVHHFSI